MGLRFKLFAFYVSIAFVAFNFVWFWIYYSDDVLLIVTTQSLPKINCSKIIEGDANELAKASRLLPHEAKLISLSDYEKRRCSSPTQNTKYHRNGIIHNNLTALELSFPLAFTILTYENAEQFERLLSLIYRPHNIYCIHVDKKSSARFYETIKSIVNCYENVFIATELERIVYAGFSRLKADLNCMQDIYELTKRDDENKNSSSSRWQHEHLSGKSLFDWKYLINLASSEFPLRTNTELVHILSLFDGRNDIEIMGKFHLERVKYKWIVNEKTMSMVRTSELKEAPPFNYTIVKGIAYCLFSRAFVEYALTDERAKSLLAWSQDTYSPDEWYWSTLQFNAQFGPPGTYANIAQQQRFVPTLSRYIGWRSLYACRGQLRHNICLFSIHDLSHIAKRNELFVNKLDLERDPLAFHCMREWYLRRQQRENEINGTTSSFDIRPYTRFVNRLRQRLSSFL